MTDSEVEKVLAELDRLLNDPEVRMDPARVWALAGRLSATRTSVSAEATGAAH